MKILFVTNEIPFPPDSGIRIPSYHAMRLMHEAGHELALATLTSENEEIDKRFRVVSNLCVKNMAFKELLPDRHPINIHITAGIKNRLSFVERYDSPEFRNKLAGIIDKFSPNVIHFDLIPMVQYCDLTPSGVGAVASINDSYSLGLKNMLGAMDRCTFNYAHKTWQFFKVRSYEKFMYTKFHQVHVMSEIDKGYLQDLNPRLKVSVISNGVEPSLFDVADDTRSMTDVIFVATLEGDNLLYLQRFLKHSWPMVSKRYPNVTLNIFGKIGQPARNLIEQYGSQDGVRFHGYIENLCDAYRMCGIAVAPINKNCGIVNKAIEAMAAGLVVVGFQKTFSGIPQAKSGVHYVEARDYESMGQAILTLLGNKVYCDELKVGGHKFAQEYYSWSDRKDLYCQMYERAEEDAKTRSVPRSKQQGLGH